MRALISPQTLLEKHMKSTTIERYKSWCEHAKASDKFTWEGKGYTKAQFDALHFGGMEQKPAKTINTDMKEKEHEDLERSHDSRDTDID